MMRHGSNSFDAVPFGNIQKNELELKGPSRVENYESYLHDADVSMPNYRSRVNSESNEMLERTPYE